MRNLVVSQLQGLLANQFGDLLFLREVRALVGRVIERSFRQQVDQLLAKLADAVAGHGAHRVESVEVTELRGPLHLTRNVAGLQPVDLVERDHHGRAEREDAVGNEAVACADSLARGEDEEDAVDIVEGLVDRALHALGQRIARPLESGQVGKDELVTAAVRDPEDPPTSRLRLVRDDRDLAARERIHERRLANVRPPGDRDEPAPHVSAARRPRPAPRPLSGWGSSLLPRRRRYR